MTLALKLLKYKTALIIASAMMMSALFAPAIFAVDDDVAEDGDGGTDVFGVSEISDNINLGSNSLQATVTGVINVALSLLGIIAVVIILIGGFKWMTAGGSEDKVAEARKLIFAGIVGLAIIMSAWAIARFVINSLGRETGVKDFEEF